ncbi:MAG: hypothetical protein HY341_00855 [Candidatus Kerfeldbacteria bacterium]|nr:hypothetical protein [Candidatus Kerfeldbacteria bacterium]
MTFLRPTRRIVLTFAVLVLIGFLLGIVSENAATLIGMPWITVQLLFTDVRDGDIAYTRLPVLADTLSWIAALVPFYVLACTIEWLRKRKKRTAAERP